METRYNFFEEINLSQLPDWEDLPDLDLYLDQVLYYVNKVSQTPLNRDSKGLTSSMVNNYVKNKHIEKPIKKKYHKQHLARLIAITFLKNVFSLQEINAALTVLRQQYGSKELYQFFVRCMNENDSDLPEIIIFSCSAIKFYYRARLLTLEMEKTTSDESDT